MPSWRIFPLETMNPVENMAKDEAIFRVKSENLNNIPNTIRFYRWKPSSVSIGKNQILEEEVDIESCQSNNISIIRRISGGGSVFHMYEGEITYSIITNLAELNLSSSKECYFHVLSALARGFQSLNIQSDQGQVHCPALLVNNKKISGNAQAISGNTLLQHGTVLVKYNPELMYTVLKARPDKPRVKMIQSVYAHVTTLEQLGVTTDFKEISEHLKRGFEKEFNIKQLQLEKPVLTSEEKDTMKLIAKERYSSQDWINSKNETELINFN